MEDLTTLCYVVASIFFVIAMITILMRIWVRGVAMRSFGWDDWLMAAHLIFFPVQQAMLYFFLHYGAGTHITDFMATQPQNMTTLLKGLLVEEYLYVFMQMSIKMCFLLFFFRLSQTRWFLYALWATIGWHLSTTVAIWLLYSFQCQPLAAFWDPASYPEVQCLTTDITYFIPYSLNLFTDILIFILPIPMIWTLNMSVSRRVSVLVVLTTGGSAVLTGGLRAIILFNFSSSPDFTWQLGNMVIISEIELAVGVLAANMPALKAFWTCWRQGTLGPGQGKALSQASNSLSQPRIVGRSTHELDERGISVKSDVRVDMGRPSRLPSSESEEELWESQRLGLEPRNFKTAVQANHE